MFHNQPMRKILISVCGFGFLMGIIFPFYADHFVDWIPERRNVFVLGCIVAGILVGIFAYFIVKLILSHIESFYKNTLVSELGIDSNTKLSTKKDMLLSMKEDFEILINDFVQMKENIEHKKQELEKNNQLLNKKNEEVLFRQKELLKTMEALEESEKRFRSFFNTAIDAIYIMDHNGMILDINPAAENVSEYSYNELINQSFSKILHPNIKGYFHENIKNLIKLGSNRTEFHLISKTQKTITVDCSSSVIRDEKGDIKYLVAFQRDISQLKEKEKQIKYIAFHDVLTDLPNRRYGKELLDCAINRAKNVGKMVGVLFIDLDQFKNINDTFGHSEGDILLSEVAKRLKKCVRGEDTVVRLGGDEFMIILYEISCNSVITKMAERIINEFTEPFIIREQEQHITCSIGVAIYPEHGEDAEVIIKSSDIAMYRAKESGRDNYKMFSNTLHSEICNEIKVKQELIKAIERKELLLHYQPIINMTTREIVATEVLVRWDHPQKGVLFPNDFIPTAEKYGIIQYIDRLVMETAFEEIEKLGDKRSILGVISFNISANEFNNQFVEYIDEILSKVNIDYNSINIEITETTAMKNTLHAHKVFQDLKKRGIKLTIDDFGTGYSSLNYLKEFPIDMLKIDKTFIDNICTDKANKAIVLSVITLAKALGIRLIAEGVETKPQLQILKELGCEDFQRYLLSKPAPIEEMRQLINNKGTLLKRYMES